MPMAVVGKGGVVGIVPGGNVEVEEGTGVAVPDTGVANDVSVTPGPGYSSVAVSLGPGYCEVSVAAGPGYSLVPVTVGVLVARASTVTVAPVVLVTV